MSWVLRQAWVVRDHLVSNTDEVCAMRTAGLDSGCWV